MTQEELKQLLSELLQMPKEIEWVEFKEASQSFHFDKLGKYFSALSNEVNLKHQSSAWLVFGVNDQRNIVGSQYRPNRPHLDSLKSEIANHTTGRITFVEIYELNLPEGRVVIFQIPPAPKGIPIAWKGHYYGRDDEELTALNIQEIEQIRNLTQASDWSAQICQEATIDDLDPEAILKARKEYKQKYPRLSDEVDAWDDSTFLNKAKVTKRGEITRSAIILLGKEESEHFLSPSVARITWILKDENNTEKDYEHIGPPFILNGEKVFAKVRNLHYRYLPDMTLFPIEVTQYDPWVIREALHNCIAHQDYKLKGRINIVEKPDELIFTNAGHFIPGNIETVILQDSPPEIYRNPFLAQAMVSLNMIDTIGSGIKKMFQKQRQRFFPLPDYDLRELDKVVVKIQGKILDENYTRLLVENTDLDLMTVMLLDKVQKHISLTRDEHKSLKVRRLVEGRYPNLYVSSKIAMVIGEKAKYIRDKGFDEAHYQKLVLALIKKYGVATRKDIDELLMDKLPDVLNGQQKKNKINRLLSNVMSRRLNLIKNTGSKRMPAWVLVKEQDFDLID